MVSLSRHRSSVGSLSHVSGPRIDAEPQPARTGRWFSDAHHLVMPDRVIRLRYGGSCSQCREPIPSGSRAWWSSETKVATCLTCTPDISRATETPEPETVTLPDAGIAGASAQTEYEKRHRRREQKIDKQWGRFAGVVKFLSDDPQSIRAWAKGSDGERQLAAALLKGVGDGAIFLHDRKVPGTRGNIDHLAVAASGVWVIDAKNYTGMVEQRNKGGWFRTENHLYVGTRDQTKLAAGLAWQVTAVKNALLGTDVPVNAALCFVGAEWRLFAKPFQQDGVWVTWEKKLAEMIAAPGPLTDIDVAHVADRLATGLPGAG